MIGWNAKDLGNSNWTRRLPDNIVNDIKAMASGAAASEAIVNFGLSLMEEIESDADAILLKGFPIFKDEKDSAVAALKFSALLGHPVSQTKAGERVVFIRDEGGDASKATVRGHKTAAALPFHCDRTDVIALICLSPGNSGGQSQIASAIRVGEVIRHERPDLHKELYQPFPQDRRGEEQPGQKPWTMMPIFYEHNGTFVSRYIRRFIDSASRFADAPKLTDRQTEALDFLDSVLDRTDIHVAFNLEAGDYFLVNNYTVWHARSAFDQAAGENSPRTLLRIWIAPPNSRELPDDFADLYGSVAAGAVRGGVPAAE
jgi:Taurine catabolism dioxygenase TauD, TfdA family